MHPLPADQVRLIGRSGKGVKGIRLGKGDQVVGMEVTTPGERQTLVTACVFGYGKRTELSEYRDQNHAGGGVITIKTTDRNGPVIGIKLVSSDNDLMFMTEKGMATNSSIHTKSLSVIGRNTQGYRLLRLEEGDELSMMAPVVVEEGKEGETLTERKKNNLVSSSNDYQLPRRR